MDAAGNSQDSNGIRYQDMVEIQYRVNRIDPDTGLLDPKPPQDTPPSNLRNGDQITVELIVKSAYSDYKLSKNVSVSLTVANLPEIVTDVDLPQFIFTGEDGTGSAFIVNAPPSGKR